MTSNPSPSELKDQGNVAFNQSNFSQALELYSNAIKICEKDDKNLLETLYSNRAAVYLKQDEFKSALEDANTCLSYNPANCKALFRAATAMHRQKNHKEAMQTLSRLLKIDPKNTGAQDLMREARQSLSEGQGGSSAIADLLAANNRGDVPMLDTLSGLISLCADDKSHAIDLGRKGGLQWIDQLIYNLGYGKLLDPNNVVSATKAFKCISAACLHNDFVKNFVDANGPPSYVIHATDAAMPARGRETNSDGSFVSPFITSNGKVSFLGLSTMISSYEPTVQEALVSTLVQILKQIPLTVDDTKVCDKVDGIELYLKDAAGKALLIGLACALRSPKAELFSLASEAFTAFISEAPNFLGTEKLVDKRMESMEERKKRLHVDRMLHLRSTTHASWAIEKDLVHHLMVTADCENPHLRQRSNVCLARLFNAVDKDDLVKNTVVPYVAATDGLAPDSSPSLVVEPLTPEHPVLRHPIELMRRRAILEAALFTSSRGELGVWALEQRSGIQQLLWLVSSGQDRCQEVASEVMALAAASEHGSGLLAPLLETGALQTLLKSTSSGVRAAAASTMTKLSIKAKAFAQDSSELTDILSTVLTVLRTSPASTLQHASAPSESALSHTKSNSRDSDVAADKLVSFSKHQLPSAQSGSQTSSGRDMRLHDAKSGTGGDYTTALVRESAGSQLVSTERAIEVLASLVGRTHIKEEIVHGSSRLAPCVTALLALDLDMRSTAAYGLAHILAAATVTNHELRAKALAEKDMTPEQHDKLQEMQRLKTEDEHGNLIEERREPTDPDSDAWCKRRCQKIVEAGGVGVLLRLIARGSTQTREAAARALRQLCVDDSSGARGQVLQQGGLATCADAVAEEDSPKPLRLECAHCVAKTLVTTNPGLLTEHTRLGTLPSLLLLCRDVDATSLMQFEALLALTNLTSCGATEHDRLADLRGVGAVHYLMFSEHPMVRRAATEALCNMAGHPKLLELLRKPETVRLWLGLCEEFDKDIREDLEAATSEASEDKAEGEEDIEEVVSEGVKRLGTEERVTPATVGRVATLQKVMEEAREKVVTTEPYKTARAASATLATSCSDAAVVEALIAEKCASTFVTLLNSGLSELVHRILVAVLEAASGDCIGAAQHLVDGGIVPAIATVTKMNDATLGELAKETAAALSQGLTRQAPAKGADTT